MQLTSSAFQTGGAIPARYTSDGGDISPDSPGRKPQIERSHLFLSRTTRTLPEPVDLRIGWFTTFLRVSDPLQKMSPSRSWLPRWDFKARTTVERWGMWAPVPLRVSTVTSLGCLPWIKNSTCRLEPSHQQVTSAMENHQLGVAELMGTYARKSERAA